MYDSHSPLTPDFKTGEETTKLLEAERLPWRTDEPPKDGSTIVALGNITEDCGDGVFNVEPFTESIYWAEDCGWMQRNGLGLVQYLDAEVTIHRWLPQPD